MVGPVEPLLGIVGLGLELFVQRSDGRLSELAPMGLDICQYLSSNKSKSLRNGKHEGSFTCTAFTEHKSQGGTPLVTPFNKNKTGYKKER